MDKKYQNKDFRSSRPVLVMRGHLQCLRFKRHPGHPWLLKQCQSGPVARAFEAGSQRAARDFSAPRWNPNPHLWNFRCSIPKEGGATN